LETKRFICRFNALRPVVAGIIIGALGGYAVNYLDPALQRKFLAVSNMFIGLLMIATGLMYNFPSLKFCQKFKTFYRPEWSSLFFGLFTGFNICPPFFMAAVQVFGKGDGLHGMLYFLMFFFGTSVYFIPLMLVHRIKKHIATLRMIARLTLILLGIYFFLVQGLFFNAQGVFK
jgi:sulfite exporter TauE/SafE